MSRRITDIPWLASALPSLKPKYPPPPVTSTFPGPHWASVASSPCLEAAHSGLLQLALAAPCGLCLMATAGLEATAGPGRLTQGRWVRWGGLCAWCPVACRRQRETLWQGSFSIWHTEPPPSLMLGPHSSIDCPGWVGAVKEGDYWICPAELLTLWSKRSTPQSPQSPIIFCFLYFPDCFFLEI